MPKIMLHDEAARDALGRGVAKLAKAVRGTLGPKGMNAIMDRPIGTVVDWEAVERHFPNIKDQVEIVHVAELEISGEDIRARVPDLTRIRAMIGYTPEYQLDDILREVIAWKRQRLAEANEP